jgi:GT2 family glycosyltransferase
VNPEIQLSIGIVSYNRPKELVRTIKSLLPLPDNVEIIICDDKSPKYSEIQENLKDLISINGIKFFSNPINLGYDRNLFQVITLSNSDYVLLLGDDDYLEEGTIYNILKVISGLNDITVSI